MRKPKSAPKRQRQEPRPRRPKVTAKLDDLAGESDGIVDAEMEELDTDRYEPPRLRHR